MARAAVAVPDRVDWRSKLPPCYDQGDLGTCTANATAGAIQFLQAIQGEPLVMPSRLFIYWNSEALEGTQGTDSGAELRDVIKAVNAQGYCPESEWNYIDNRLSFEPDAKCYADAAKDLLLQYQSVDNTNLNALLQAIAIGPVLGGFSVYESFESDAVAKSGIAPMPGPDEGMVGGHAILVVGYDTAAKVFICRNSWGPAWGQGGYFQIPFGYFTNPDLADDFWLLQRIT